MQQYFINDPNIDNITWEPLDSLQFAENGIYNHSLFNFDKLKEIFKKEEIVKFLNPSEIFMDTRILVEISQNFALSDGKPVCDLDDFPYLLINKIIYHYQLEENNELRNIILGEFLTGADDTICDCRGEFLQTLECPGFLYFYRTQFSGVNYFQENSETFIPFERQSYVHIEIPPHSLIFIEREDYLVECCQCSIVDVENVETRGNLLLLNKDVELFNHANQIEDLRRGIHRSASYIVRSSSNCKFITNNQVYDKDLCECLKINGFYMPVCQGKICEFGISWASSPVDIVMTVDFKFLTKMKFKIVFFNHDKEQNSFILESSDYIFIPSEAVKFEIYVCELMAHPWVYFQKELFRSPRNEELLNILFKEMDFIGSPSTLSFEELKAIKPILDSSKMKQTPKKLSLSDKKKEDLIELIDPCGIKFSINIILLKNGVCSEKLFDLNSAKEITYSALTLSPVVLGSKFDFVENIIVEKIRSELLSRKQPHSNTQTPFLKTIQYLTINNGPGFDQLFFERTRNSFSYFISEVEHFLEFRFFPSKFEFPKLPQELFCSSHDSLKAIEFLQQEQAVYLRDNKQ
eukprot:NODE_63_length_26141_cov_1.022656.p3 type:complete len:577 gc:universal NODE_63_length_26141_cov_1.022656:14496-12766(-)